MQLTKQLIGLVPLTLILLGLLSYNFMSAQWTGPSATAPGNNATAPINISNNYQAKLGDLGAVRMRAGEYCDAAGLNCFIAADVASTTNTGYGMAFGAHSEAQCIAAGGAVYDTGYTKICRFNSVSCPAGWAQFENWNTNAGRACVGACGSCSVPAQSFGDSATSFTYFNQGRKADCSPAAAAACGAIVTARGCY